MNTICIKDGKIVSKTVGQLSDLGAESLLASGYSVTEVGPEFDGVNVDEMTVDQSGEIRINHAKKSERIERDKKKAAMKKMPSIEDHLLALYHARNGDPKPLADVDAKIAAALGE